ncbi:MAG: O-acetylhomoserine aminocarboxypropyltransferase/cysteine synthase [Firmicutes bacterium]|jgi:O-acetylhomoserine (thiol)-lyase|nr:O-acetylhomoserine aminocarboxypropyltransferase/cysteine synthase [Bacillota bacterium]
MQNQYRFETLQLHAGQEIADPTTHSRAVPIYQTTSYLFDSCQHAADLFDLKAEGNIYSRMMNPTTDTFEARINALEGGVGALALSSGSAAVTYAIQNITQMGDHIVSANTLYGGTYNLFAHTLPKSGITTTFVNPDDVSNFEKAIQNNTKLLYIESIGNPNANMIDIEKVAEIAHAHNIPLIIDSTFATPYLLRPFEYGADIVIHSATKFIGGHGTSIGGVIVDSGNFDWEASGKFQHLVEPDPSYHGISFTKTAGKAAYITRARVVLLRDTGACLSPFHSFLFLQGLETLSLRVERHVENTLKVVEYLSKHTKVKKVNHPSLPDSPYYKLYKKYLPKGGASIFTIETTGTREDANRFVDNLKLFSLLANVADVKSLVINPAGTTHSQMTDEELNACGIAPTTIRLSIGTEHIDDIIADLEQAFEKM